MYQYWSETHWFVIPAPIPSTDSIDREQTVFPLVVQILRMSKFGKFIPKLPNSPWGRVASTSRNAHQHCCPLYLQLESPSTLSAAQSAWNRKKCDYYKMMQNRLFASLINILNAKQRISSTDTCCLPLYPWWSIIIFYIHESNFICLYQEIHLCNIKNNNNVHNDPDRI